ncbi:ABC transporter permease [Vibrio crassostreae]|uniref:ABC transporter permease n=1 Tax=Vibrio crassostreae TaxID=246167 RepID=UPI000F4A205A|nr:ABC transporter permease [Vibrio crassostreae]ROO49970.1 lipopolysaccharide transport system permease protein [Vibrio crassostreae]ROO53473.1 lipopolysaccharide transport system permease protein [Vibrio crassostreae]ROO66483.1 lipopolysaccharide transport system permease protein [Vibrio crassostreae]ROO68265.1 lipopolysaccharide transport system permease protein [Vibrio crassostreae]ROR62377.1 lipopolysaccharide transport system permease protein [Vibrio crassostreae]
MATFSGSPKESLKSLIRNKTLIISLVKRDVIIRYKGSLFGWLWSFLTPLFMLSVYTLVFGEILKVKWHSGGNEVPGQFAMLLFAGLIIFNMFSECINRSPITILSNVNYVKKIVFPLEILPVVTVLSTLFHAVVSLLVWVVVYMILFGLPHKTLLLAPVTLIPIVLLVSGFSFILSALGVFVRDINQVVGLICTGLMFLSPIFYPISSLPTQYQFIVSLNPLTLPIEEFRKVAFFGENPDLISISIYLVIAIWINFVGFYFFQKTRKAFADVL